MLLNNKGFVESCLMGYMHTFLGFAFVGKVNPR
jgi:hypothetical protein